jgi:hypothetical protein
MRLWLLPEISNRLAPVKFVIVNLPADEVALMANSPLVRIIVQTPFPVQFGEVGGIAKSIVSSASEEFARVMASRKLPEPLFAVVVTV